MIYFTELENLPIFDARGEYLGRLVDLGINPSQNPLQVATYYVRSPKKELLSITQAQLPSISVRAAQTRVPAEDLGSYTPEEDLIRIKKDVLDQQIIDVNDQKVVRVNDVDFDIRPSDGYTDLHIVAVNVGWEAAVRRLLQGVFAKHTIRRIAGLFSQKTIPWEFVNLIEPDPSRRVRLRISYSRLADLHPADLADILEELSRDEQKSVIESLDDETAAQAVSEIPTRMQVALLESIPASRAADIVEEMPPDEAADVLQELPPETSAQVLANMEKEEAKEVRNLLGFEENTAGGLMTTEFIVVGDLATVEAAVAALKAFDGSMESVHAIYLIDPNATLTGVVPLARILLAEASTPLRGLSMDPVISVPFHADDKAVVTLFNKYNLLTLPVVDDNGRMLGVVTADDVLEILITNH
ncbi:MAG: CBS domain-containing protein [Acidobacteriia bacterium]|nr:CBS domain-containing protein [Terriglobia bacterium]